MENVRNQQIDNPPAPALGSCLALHRCPNDVRLCDADDLLELIEALGAIPAIPARQNRTQPRYDDAHLYKERHLVECFINKIKWYRRIFSRFDKLALHFMGYLAFVASLIWLR